MVALRLMAGVAMAAVVMACAVPRPSPAPSASAPPARVEQSREASGTQNPPVDAHETFIDTDGDRIADRFDACVRDPETWNGAEDGDGCPDGSHPRRNPPPAPITVVSPDGRLRLTSARPDAGPAWLEVVERHTERRMIRVRCVNRLAPHRMLVTDGGRIVTIDDRYRRLSQHAVVIYDERGTVIADLPAEHLLHASELARVPLGNWVADATADDTSLRIRTTWGDTVTVALDTGRRMHAEQVVQIPSLDERLRTYFSGVRLFDTIQLSIDGDPVCDIRDTEARWRGTEIAAQYSRRRLRDALAQATSLVDCLIRPSEAGVLDLRSGPEIQIVTILVTEAAHTYRWYARTNSPACAAAVERLRSFAPPDPGAPEDAR